MHHRSVEYARNRQLARQRWHHLGPARRADEQHALGAQAVYFRRQLLDAAGAEHHARRQADVDARRHRAMLATSTAAASAHIINSMRSVVAANDVQGGSPISDSRELRLWWIDVQGRRLHRYAQLIGAHCDQPLPEQVGSIALRARGGLVLATRTGFRFY